ncbi:MAG: SoxR reducing system RseC family protein [Caldicoprobacter sp.]|uniref:SoxR reducing system RseC family protein n=1 Tax=Caldicoprobacter sp. TaxID=2004500 RepID=UPI001DA86B3E|nr:Fis family transcriptional regulator [Clostridia bacterium]
MREVGEVIRVEGDRAIVRIQRSSACRHCGACGLGASSDEMLLTLPNSLNAKPGDMVELSIESVHLLKASAITYLIPLAALILGVIVGYVLGGYLAVDRQLAGAVLGLAFTGLAFMLIRTLDPVFKRSNNFTPTMVAVLNVNNNKDNK